MVKIKGWLTLTLEPVQLLVVGRLYSHTQHYVPAIRSSAACMAPNECLLCDQAAPVQQIALLPVKRLDADDVHFIRLLPSQTSLISSLASQGNSLIGTLIEAERSGAGTLKRPLIRKIGHRPTNPPPLDNYIKAIGRKAYERAIEIMLAQPELGES